MNSIFSELLLRLYPALAGVLDSTCGPAAAEHGIQILREETGCLWPTEIKAALDKDDVALVKVRERMKDELAPYFKRAKRGGLLRKGGIERGWLIFAVTLLVFFNLAGLLIVFAVYDIPDGKMPLFQVALGAFVTAFQTAIGYWLGSSRGSQDKDVVLGNIAAAQIPPAAPTPPPVVVSGPTVTTDAAAAPAAPPAPAFRMLKRTT
jgi:hypothetical protein